jgi:hypothetical protein
MLLAIIGLGYYNHKANLTAAEASAKTREWENSHPKFMPSRTAPGKYRCDGRTHCSQMRSCEEAKYFIQHCPRTQMDGDNDGIPCESQWCN